MTPPVSPTQSTWMASAGLCSMRMRTSWLWAQPRCPLQKAGYMQGSSPLAIAASRYSFHSGDIVMPRLPNSAAMLPWSMVALSLDLRALLGQMTDLTVASSTSSGSGHAIPRARAAPKTSDTVDRAHPHEYAMPSWLTPIAANRRISLYLTILLPFSRWPWAPFAPRRF